MFYALGSVPVPVLPYLISLLAVFTVCVLVLAVAALLDSDAELPLVRLAQTARLSRTRMARMLKRREVPFIDYVGRLSAATLKQQAEICGHCACTELCDRALKSRGGAQTHTQFTFCPNQPAIERYRDLRSRISGACFSR